MKQRPGDDVAAYCGRCKAERTHQIVALNENGAPAAVICRTCGAQHRFRELKGETAAPPSSRGGARKSRAADSAAASARDAAPVSARAYAPRETYAEGEWIEHTKFGVGKVTAARGGKIEVRFKSENRVLVHAG
jgi:hypothetical protein